MMHLHFNAFITVFSHFIFILGLTTFGSSVRSVFCLFLLGLAHFLLLPFCQNFAWVTGICCILIGQSQSSGVVGFKKRILFTVIMHVLVYLSCITENEKMGLVVVSVTSLHPPASSNRAIKMEKTKKEMLLKRAKTRHHFFFRKTIGSNNSYILIENNFRFLR